MAQQITAQQSRTWARKSTFILAAAGSAIGLGNLWKFPYMVGEGGGSAFVLVYLFFIFVIGLPVMMGESIVGKFSKKNPFEAVKQASFASGSSRVWQVIPILGFVALFLLFSFYSVVAGWSIDYALAFGRGDFNGKDAAAVGAMFEALLASPERLAIYSAVFSLLTAVVVGMGIKKGIENFMQLLMPVLFVLVFGLVIYAALNTGKFVETANYLFRFDLSKLTAEVAINAMGQAFFSLSLGMVVIMTYAAYMQPDTSISSSAIWVTSLDTALALLAGFAIFPFVFASGMSPSSGPGLLFVSLSSAFASMPAGQILGASFFFLVFLAAISSSISMVEPFIKWFTDTFNAQRLLSSLIYCLLCFGFGLLVVFSFNLLKDVHPVAGKTWFELIDYVTSNILLPLGGLLVALYVGWGLHKNIAARELGIPALAFGLWLFLIRYVVPIAIMIIFAANVLGTDKLLSLLNLAPVK